MKYKNIHTNETYTLIDECVTNATNKESGKIMVLYKNCHGKSFVRNREEFFKKFEIMR